MLSKSYLGEAIKPYSLTTPPTSKDILNKIEANRCLTFTGKDLSSAHVDDFVLLPLPREMLQKKPVQLPVGAVEDTASLSLQGDRLLQQTQVPLGFLQGSGFLHPRGRTPVPVIDL